MMRNPFRKWWHHRINSIPGVVEVGRCDAGSSSSADDVEELWKNTVELKNRETNVGGDAVNLAPCDSSPTSLHNVPLYYCNHKTLSAGKGFLWMDSHETHCSHKTYVSRMWPKQTPSKWDSLAAAENKSIIDQHYCDGTKETIAGRCGWNERHGRFHHTTSPNHSIRSMRKTWQMMCMAYLANQRSILATHALWLALHGHVTIAFAAGRVR